MTSVELTYVPASKADADELLDLIDELHDYVAAGRTPSMGLGDDSIANGIRARFTQRLLDVALAAIPAPPLDDALIERCERARKAYREASLASRSSSGAPERVRALEDEVWAAYRSGYMDGAFVPGEQRQEGYERTSARADAAGRAYIAVRKHADRLSGGNADG